MSVTYTFDEEENNTMCVAEPPAAFGAVPTISALRKRVVTREEIADCITLDELDRHLTELIHSHYHPAV